VVIAHDSIIRAAPTVDWWALDVILTDEEIQMLKAPYVPQDASGSNASRAKPS
jgi:hypothetical protein